MRPPERKQDSGGPSQVKFVVDGVEVVEKTVASNGNCGRIYLPLSWLGKKVKIVRLD
jgi:putative transposon-encoded protein